jgi:hypothetical protein
VRESTHVWTSVDAAALVPDGSTVAAVRDDQGAQWLVRWLAGTGAVDYATRVHPPAIDIQALAAEIDEQTPAIAGFGRNSLLHITPSSGKLATVSTFNYTSAISASYWDRRSHRAYAQVSEGCKPHWGATDDDDSTCILKFDVLNGWLIAANPADGAHVVRFADWWGATVPGTALSVPALVADAARCPGTLGLATFNLERGGSTPGPCTKVATTAGVTAAFSSSASHIAVTSKTISRSSTLYLVDAATGATLATVAGSAVLDDGHLADDALVVSTSLSLTAC